MVCSKCHRDIPDDAVLCCYCGKKYIYDRKAPKRGNKQGTAFKRGSTWTAQVTVGYRERKSIDLKNPPPEAKKQRQAIRRSKGGFKTKAAALAYVPTLLAGGGTKTETAPRLEHYWSIYSSGEMAELSESKQYAYKGAWNRLEPLHLSRVDTISVGDLRRVVANSCKTFYPAKDCKTVLSILFKLAAADGFANKDLPSFIPLPKLEEKERQAFTREEQEALWKLYESGNVNAAMPLLMIYTGMMPGEAMNLRTDQIDLANCRIVGAGMKTAVRKKTPIVLADCIIPLVQDLIDHAQPDGHLWKMDAKTWRKVYYSVLEEARCRQLTPYSCRHTTATALAITEGIAPQTVQKVMRWSNSKMLDRYAHPTQKDALNAVNSIPRVANNITHTETATR